MPCSFPLVSAQSDVLGANLDALVLNLNALGANLDALGANLDALGANLVALGANLDALGANLDVQKPSKVLYCRQISWFPPCQCPIGGARGQLGRSWGQLRRSLG